MPPVLLPTDAERRGPAPIGSFHYGEFDAAELAVAKQAGGARVHVVIPARDEADTIGAIVGAVRRDLVDAVPLVDEILVVDDASTDVTARLAEDNGARVVAGRGLGKGEAMAVGLDEASLGAGSLVVFLDGDVRGFGSGYVTGLVGPLLAHDHLSLVKGRYRRPLGDEPAGGGRVTELVAKPALRLFFPDLACLDQPLAGETAVRASLLDLLALESGYAVEVALLIDAYRLVGLASLAEVDLGERRHRNRSLEELAPEADTVLRTVVGRAAERGLQASSGT